MLLHILFYMCFKLVFPLWDFPIARQLFTAPFMNGILRILSTLVHGVIFESISAHTSDIIILQEFKYFLGHSFFFLMNLFSWRLITLQYCSGFFLPYIDINQPWVYMCHPSWISLPPPSPCPPSGLSQCAGFECPVSCIELGLVIYFTYGNIHVSMLFSQIIPPRLLPQSPKVCSLYLCLFCCLVYRVVITIFLNSIYMR